mmetsp:Transcript_11547/g.17419  ORF Transcript_11547/g.17419 Transcript_11547/m.17419 type:complete len:98 (+) Transcript_11547:791-1084(+)
MDEKTELVWPDYIATYSGNDWSTLTSLGGWGDLSIQAFDLTSTSYYEFGTYGKVATDPTDSGATPYAYDLNTAECVDRFAVVHMYNSGSTAVAITDS